MKPSVTTQLGQAVRPTVNGLGGWSASAKIHGSCIVAVLLNVCAMTAGTTDSDRIRSQAKMGTISTQETRNEPIETGHDAPGYWPPISRVGRCQSANTAPVVIRANIRPLGSRRGNRNPCHPSSSPKNSGNETAICNNTTTAHHPSTSQGTSCCPNVSGANWLRNPDMSMRSTR